MYPRVRKVGNLVVSNEKWPGRLEGRLYVEQKIGK
jgi:hypothetical protein